MSIKAFSSYDAWVLGCLFKNKLFLENHGRDLGKLLLLFFKKNDLEIATRLLKVAEEIPALRKELFDVVFEIAKQKPDCNKKLFLHKLIVRKVLTKDESLVIVRIEPYSKLLLDGVRGLDLNRKEEMEVSQLNKPFEKTKG